MLPCTSCSPGSLYVATIQNTSHDGDWFQKTRVDVSKLNYYIFSPSKEQQSFLWNKNIADGQSFQSTELALYQKEIK